MLPTLILFVTLLATGVVALPRTQDYDTTCTESRSTDSYDTSTTLLATLSVTTTHTVVVTISTNDSPVTTSSSSVDSITTTVDSSTTISDTDSSTSAPPSYPTQPYTLQAVLSGSRAQSVPINAAGGKFWLGGQAATYCPESINTTASCPPGNTTAFAGTCGMDAVAPGGQFIYAAPDGSLSFSRAHSTYYTPGSQLCPLSYEEAKSGDFSLVDCNAFGAQGFMACPTNDASPQWQVFAAMANATVPNGDISSCVEFSAIASNYGPAGTQLFAAWQYV